MSEFLKAYMCTCEYGDMYIYVYIVRLRIFAPARSPDPPALSDATAHASRCCALPIRELCTTCSRGVFFTRTQMPGMR